MKDNIPVYSTEYVDSLHAHVAELHNALSDVMAASGGSEKMCGHEYHCVCPTDRAVKALTKTPPQSLSDLRSQAVTDLITECSYSTQVNGIATSIIDVDSAISYADRLKGKG